MERKDADVLEKCRAFRARLGALERDGLSPSHFRVTIEGPLDHRIEVRDPKTGRLRSMICFDSNSYLGLHLHPRVVGAVRKALDRVGAGTPSAQLLGGTNFYLRELEETVSDFHGREETIVFPSGYAANVGLLTALVGPSDLVAYDQFSHASLRDGVKYAGVRLGGPFRHRDVARLSRVLARHADRAAGKLIATDGVFSMHGDRAPLRELREAADRHGARLLVDEAHSVGVLGATGRGLEEEAGLPGAADILMGTFSKAPGGAGGYVTGSAELISFLRFNARAGLFTASIPAASCAGLAEAFRVMRDEPDHRERLWANARLFHRELRAAGLPVPAALESPIIPVFAGEDALLFALGSDVFQAGIKCGSVCFPAVPRHEAILRFSVNARHTEAELHETVGALVDVYRRHDVLRRSPDEIREIGWRLSPDQPREAA